MKKSKIMRVDEDFALLVGKICERKQMSTVDATKLIGWKVKTGIFFTTEDWW
jgi:hypothetical protein